MTTPGRWQNWKPKAQALTGPAGIGPLAAPPGPQKF